MHARDSDPIDNGRPLSRGGLRLILRRHVTQNEDIMHVVPCFPVAPIDKVPIEGVHPQIIFLLVRTMAGHAVFLQNRGDLLVV